MLKYIFLSTFSIYYLMNVLAQNTLNNKTNGEIIIGTGTVDYCYPVNGYFAYTYSQSIYLQSELGSSTVISKIAYYFNGTSLSNTNKWTIYLGHTNKTAFNEYTSDWVPYSSLTEVYSGTFTSPTGPGWIEFDIEDFPYNGIDNLVIACIEKAPGYNDISDYFLATDMSQGATPPIKFKRSISTHSDSNIPNPQNPPLCMSYNHLNVIPNIKITTTQPNSVNNNSNEFCCVNIYPNPANETLNITNSNGYTLNIYNILGKPLITKKLSEENNQIDIMNLPAGVYNVFLTNDEKTHKTQIIKN